MKRILLIGVVIAGLGLLVAGFAVPAFANGANGEAAALANQEAWKAMHEACKNGDWQAMAEAAKEAHGDKSGEMSCPTNAYSEPDKETQEPANGCGGMEAHMGGGMMDSNGTMMGIY